jgi:two-component system nitrogen regulation response regulator GlnG
MPALAAAQTLDQQLSLEAVVYRRVRAYAEALQDHEPRELYNLLLPQLERPLIRVAMELAEGRQVRAARMLGIHRNTLRVRLRELGMEGEDFGRPS